MPTPRRHAETDLGIFPYEINYRSAESFRYAREIVKPAGTIDRVLPWCKTELVGTWRWQMVEMSGDHRPGRYVFYFDDARDYTAFMLKWG
jgi:hypothetical protein